MTRLSLLLFAAAVVPATADIVFENELIKTDEIFDLDYARDSVVSITESERNTTKYYCVFRSNWNKLNHPAEYPELARWGNPLLFSHTNQYAPLLKDREAQNGVEQIAEHAFTDTFRTELTAAGNVVGNIAEGKGWFINQKQWDKNYVYLPPVNVSDQYPFLSGIADISPSPDWFTDFYLFSTYKEESQTFWDSFLILSYPWDAGTDSGQHYTDGDRDTDPPEMITRIEVGNAVNNIFLSPAGDKVIHVAEWECVLHTCPEDEPDCEKADWPPANGCDILRFPQCAETCDPTVETDCEQCKRESSQEGNVYHKNCCLAGREPKNGVCKGENGDTVSGAVSLSKATATAAVVFGLATLL